VLRAEDTLLERQQGGELVAGPGGIPCHSCPAGKVAAGGKGARVLGAVGFALIASVGDQL
jgi:hypothetical protein